LARAARTVATAATSSFVRGHLSAAASDMGILNAKNRGTPNSRTAPMYCPSLSRTTVVSI